VQEATLSEPEMPPSDPRRWAVLSALRRQPARRVDRQVTAHRKPSEKSAATTAIAQGKSIKLIFN